MSLPKWRVAALLAYNMEEPLPKTPTRCPNQVYTTISPLADIYTISFFSSLRLYLSHYRLTSATKYGPITLAAVQTTIKPSTATLYGAFHSGTSCKRTQTAYNAT
jgi:hypothetical protein